MLYLLLIDKNIPVQCNTIYNTTLKPVLLYGSEIWVMMDKLRSKITAVEIKVLRIIKGVTKRDRIRNIKIRDDLKIEPLEKSINKSNLWQHGHVKRMEENRYP